MAHNFVSNCLYIQDSNKGLTLDKLLLKENYGVPYQITSAFVSKSMTL